MAEALDARARAALHGGAVAVDRGRRRPASRRRSLDALVGLGRLQRLLDDPAVENIDCNGCDRVFVSYTDGPLEQVGPGRRLATPSWWR